MITIIALIFLGLYNFRYGKSQKYFSEDGQYSFYYKRSLLGITLMSPPGDGDTGGGTIYVYDEIEKKVIYQFESSWLIADMQASEFSSFDAGVFNCKAGHWFKLPRPIKKMSTKRIDKKTKSGFTIRIKGNLQEAQNVMHFSNDSDKGKFGYYIKIPERKILIRTAIIVEEDNDYLNITLDSILDIQIQGNTVGHWHTPKKDDVAYAKNLTKSEIESLFKEQIKNKARK